MPSTLLRRRLLCIASLLVAGGSLGAGECGRSLDTRELARMCPAQLDAVFASGSVGCRPVGAGRGRILYILDARHPRARANLVDVAWKGKYFTCDGRMVNRWAGGVRAVEAAVVVEPSLLDGKPCLMLDYPPDAPIFGNTRDELREVAPGVFLGRAYERCPQPRLKGYFVLEMAGCAGAR